MNQLNPLYERNYVCPVCRMKFTSMSIRSSAIILEKRESDFNSIYRDFSPLHYSMIVCPTCKYAASTTTFNKELPSSLVQLLSQALVKLPSPSNDFWHERDPETALESFILAIRSAQLKKSDPGELAGVMMGAAWMCREMGRTDQERTYLQEALKYYIQGYEKSISHIGNLTDVQASYLIGELNLRLGNLSEAVNWFNRTITNPNIKSNPALEKQTREQWQTAREEANKQKSDPSAETNKTSEKVNETTPPNQTRPRSTIQMLSHLYNDQIDWINQIVNHGYQSSKSLVNKEQVLRSVLDAFNEYLEGQIPDNFSTEAELKAQWLELLKSK